MATPDYVEWPDGRTLSARQIAKVYHRNYNMVCMDLRTRSLRKVYITYVVGRRLNNSSLPVEVVDRILEQYPSATETDITNMCSHSRIRRVSKGAMVVNIEDEKIFVPTASELDIILERSKGYSNGLLFNKPELTYQDIVDKSHGTTVYVNGIAYSIVTSRQLSTILGRSSTYVAQELRRDPKLTWQKIADISSSRADSRPAKKYGMSVIIGDTVHHVKYYREVDMLLGRALDYTSNLLAIHPDWSLQNVVDHSNERRIYGTRYKS